MSYLVCHGVVLPVGIRRIGIDSLNPLFELRIADAATTGDGNVDISSVLALSERINAELDKANALAIKDLKVNGKDLMALGIPSGPMIGRILSELLEEVIEDPARNDRGYLEERALTLSRCPAR